MAGKDIDIVIGAKNEASKILEQVSKDTGKLSSSVATSSKNVEQSTGQMTVGFSGLAGIAAGVATGVGVAVVAMKAVGAAAFAAASAIAGMEDSVTAFAQRTRDLGLASEAEIEFANALKESTNASVASTIQTLNYAKALGMTEQAAQDATVMAQGLARAVGVDQATAVKAVRDAMMGNADALSAMIPGMDLANTHAERMALVSANAERGLALLKNEANDSIGITEKLASAYAGLSRVIGQALQPVFDFVRVSMRQFVEAITATVGPVVDELSNSFGSLAPVFQIAGEAMRAVGVVIGVVINTIIRVASAMVSGLASAFGASADVAGSFIDAIRSVAEGVIFGITAIEVAFTNIPTIIDFAVTEALLFLEGFRADIEQTLTVAIPAYASWFAENFTSLLGDAFNAVAVAFANLAIKMTTIGQSLIDYLKSGMTEGALDLGLAVSDALSGSLLQGFEAQTAALPDIAERAQTATEKMLAERSGRIAGNLTEQFNQTYQKNLEGLNKLGGIEVGIEMPDLNSLGISNLQAMFGQPVQAAESRLQTRGVVERPFEREMLKNAQEQTKEQKEQTKAINNQTTELRRISQPTEVQPVTVGVVQ